MIRARYVRDGLGHNVTEYTIEPVLQTFVISHEVTSVRLSLCKTMRNRETLSETVSVDD